jgi:hypothetical protein
VRALLGPAGLLAGLALASTAAATPPPIMGRSPGAEAPADQASGVVQLRGLHGEAVSLTAADIASAPHVHVTLTHMGRTSDYAGPLLTDLLRRVDAPLGPRLHGRAVAVAVLVSASDDYHAVLSLTEIDPEVRPNARVILADQEDGRPLPPNEWPYRVVIEGDAKPARDVHSVVSIDLRQLP